MKQLWGNGKKWTGERKSKHHHGIIRTTCNARWPSRETKERNACADRKVKTYQACLIVKGYHQRYGIDYDEIFSPVVILKSIQIMLAIAAHMDYEI